MFYSDAFRGLNRSAIIILMRCLQKRKWEKRRDPGSSYKRTVYLNDGFVFPYSEAAFLGVRKTQFWKTVKVLVEVGFLDVLHQGGWFRESNERDLSTYRLSNRWKQYGTPAFQRVEKRQVLSPDYFIRQNLAKQSLRQTPLQRTEYVHSSELCVENLGGRRVRSSEVCDEQRKPCEGLKTQAGRSE